MTKKSFINQLVFDWIDHLEGGDQHAFALKAGLHPVTVTKWKREGRGPSKETIRSIREAYGLSVQEYESGPEVYQKKKEQQMQVRWGDSDLERASRTYVNMHPDPLKRLLCGSHWAHRDEQEPKRYFHVLVDKNGKPLTEVESIIVFELKEGENPEIGSQVLVWNGEETKVVEWMDDSKRSDYQKVWGPIIEKRKR